MKQFKRIISLVLAMTMIVSMFTVGVVSASAEDAAYILGDVDKNGKVNIFDASYIQLFLADHSGYEIAENSIDFAAADVNRDGKVNVFDVTLIQQYAAQFANALKSGIGETFTYVDPNKPTEPPATEAPVTEAPATEAPATEAPATEAPATEAPATEAPATEAPATEAPATEAPATEAPATEAPVTEAPAHTYTVAGAIAPDHINGGIFGTSWDPTNTANDLTFDETTQLWSITYADVDATGETSWYEYKVVEDHAWDKSFHDQGDAVGDGTNAKFYVLVDDSTVTIFFDGTKCWSEVVAPEVPTEAPVTEAPATEAPATEAPATEAPATEAPKTEAPATEEPEIPTEAPVTEEPEIPTEEPDIPTEEPDIPTIAPETETPGVVDAGYYLVGSLNGKDLWSVDALTADRKLKENPAAAGEYMLDWTFYGGDELKVAHFDGTKFDAWYQDLADNYKIGADSNKVGPGTLYFNPNGNSEWSYKYLTVQPKTTPEIPTEAPATEAPETEAPATEAPATEEPEIPTEAPDIPTEEPDIPTEEPEIPTVAPETEAPVEGGAGYYLVGTLNGQSLWNNAPLTTDRMLKENPAVAGEYMLDWTFYGGDELKVVYYDGKEIKNWYNPDGDNYKIGADSNKVGPGTLYFNPDGNSEWSYKYLTVQPKTTPVVPTEAPATEAPATEAPATEAPATETPATEAPATEAPEIPTIAPETEAPDVVDAGYYLVGSLNGKDFWSVDTLTADRKLKENPAAAGEYMLDWTFVGGDELKVAHFDGTKFDKWFNDGGDNYKIGADSNKVGPGTLYFNPDGNSEWSYKYLTVQPKTTPVVPTEAPATEAPATEAPATEAPATEAPATEAPSADTMTIYFQNNWMWTDVHAYFWGSSKTNSADWPGDVVKVYGNDGTYDVYSVTVPADITGLIFNGQDSGTGSRNQTPDIEDAKDGNCYYMKWDQEANKNAVGCEDISVILPDEKPTTAPATEAPATEAPATEAPATEAPATETPATEAPATEAPVTEAPATEAPATEAPVTEAPATEAPATEAPVTEAPEIPTIAPETEAPDVVDAGYYLVGSLNGKDFWSVDTLTADRKLKENPAAAGEYMLDWTFVGGDELKVAHFDGTKFDKWFNDGGDNYKIGADSNKVGPGTLYFNPNGNSEWSYKYLTVQPKTTPVVPTEAPETEAPATETPATEAPATEAPSADTMTIYFQNNWMWTDVHAYFWGSSKTNSADWPGDVVKVYGNDGTYDVYSVTVPADITGLIFNGQDSGTGSRNQTPDIKDAKDGNCYYMKWDQEANKNAVGCEDISVILPDEKPTTAPATEAPATEAPATEAPATEAPATEAPVTEAPATEAPVTEAPATEAPATEAPATEAPVTEAPATEAPATEAPVTEAPEIPTIAPETEAPDVVDAGYYLVGSLNGKDFWSVDTLTADRKLKENPAAAGEYMLDWTFVGGDELKVAHFDGTKFDKWFNDGGDNYKIGADSNKVGPGTLYFNPNGNSDWSYKYLTVQPKTTPVVPTEAPATEAPATEAPATEAPATEAPATEAPATEAPATEAPATEAPATEAPATEAPVTEAPATEAPATEAPATEAPATEAPATEAPATEAPATEAPATEAPVTEAPEIPTIAPETEAPDVVDAGYYLVGSLGGVDYWSADTLTADRKLKENPAVAGEYMLDWTFVGGDELKVAHFDGTKFDKWFNDGGDNYKIGADSNKVGPGTLYFNPNGNSDWSYKYLTVQPNTTPVVPTEAPATEAPATEAPATEAPATEAPATIAPTEKPTEAPVTTYTVYFVNSGKWSKVNVYAWSPENAVWPGEAMTKTADKAPNGAEVYSITFTTKYTNIIFNDGSSQTSDLTFTAGQYYDFATSKWYAKLSDIPSAQPTGYTVYFVNSGKWSTVNAYVWNPNGSAWPGSKMTNTGQKSSKGYDIYSMTFSQNHGNIIFNNGSGTQTSNLTFTAGQYYDFSTKKWYANANTI